MYLFTLHPFFEANFSALSNTSLGSHISFLISVLFFGMEPKVCIRYDTSKFIFNIYLVIQK